MGDVVNLHEEPSLLCSDGELQHGSTDVWAIPVFKSRTAHFFQRSGLGYHSICGAVDIPAFLGNGQCSLFAAGTYPKCKKCMRKLQKISSERKSEA